MIGKKIKLKLYICNIKHKSNHINLLLYFYFEIFKQFCSIFFTKLFKIFKICTEYEEKTFSALTLLPYIKNSIYSIADNNSNTSPDNSESDTVLETFQHGAKKKSQR